MEDSMANTHTTQPPASEGWRITIDSWVRDPAIRTFALIVLGMCLATAALVVGLATGTLITALNTVLPNLLTRMIALVGLALTGTGGWLVKRHRARSHYHGR
ncbi:MAG: hypothetical protein ACR2GH_20425 [Pseudonocardia sp.]